MLHCHLQTSTTGFTLKRDLWKMALQKQLMMVALAWRMIQRLVQNQGRCSCRRKHAGYLLWGLWCGFCTCSRSLNCGTERWAVLCFLDNCRWTGNKKCWHWKWTILDLQGKCSVLNCVHCKTIVDDSFMKFWSNFLVLRYEVDYKSNKVRKIMRIN